MGIEAIGKNVKNRSCVHAPFLDVLLYYKTIVQEVNVI